MNDATLKVPFLCYLDEMNNRHFSYDHNSSNLSNIID